MNINDIHAAYREGRIDKATFIEQMHASHQLLYAYAAHLEGTEVEEIRLLPGEVRIRLQWPPIEMLVPVDDRRAAPVEALNFGSYEKAEFAFVIKTLKALGKEQPCLLDIGGNVGFYSIGLKKLLPGLRIHAYEPVPATADQFARNCELNGCREIELHRHGLSDSNGTATFFMDPRYSVAASQRNLLDSEEAEEVQCQLLRLDGLRDRLPRPVDFIKCDIEGAELFAFRGGEALLREDRPVIFSEMLRKWSARFDYHPDEIIDFLGGLGYACHALSADGCRPVGRVTEATQETNFVFFHKEAHEGIGLPC